MMSINTLSQVLILTLFILLPEGTVLFGDTAEAPGHEPTGDTLASSPIQPYDENPWYWEYEGEPILLRGGTDDDNLFQWTGDKLTDHLDLLVSVGGNYVRNTMSDRDEGNVYAFGQNEDGIYELDQWNDEYWDRIEFLLSEAEERGIIVQLSLWDQFDLGSSEWEEHPWNPENNINMETGAWDDREDFYATVDNNDEEGLQYQRQFIDKLLSVSLSHGNVLYNINNESSESEQWENYWAQFVTQAGQEHDRQVYVTTMQFDPTNSVRAAMTYRDIYSFVEISQNNQDSRGARGQGHWDNIMNWRQKLASDPMPMNNEKVYGGADGVNYSAGTETEAINRFWRNIFAGCASSRFHRPALPRVWGSGLNERVQTNLKAMDMLLEEFDIFSASPHNDLLRHRVAAARSAAEAYVTADIGNKYAVYFPRGRFMIDLDPWKYVEQVRVRWLDIEELSWSEPEVFGVQWDGDRSNWGHRGMITLKTPGNESYVALVEVVKENTRN
ncbi:MAG: hypothetical protein WD423_10560 [Rhodothermales bacterium]